MENYEFNMELSSLPKDTWWEDDCLFQLGEFWHLPQLIKPIKRVIKNFKPLPSDVILASFPKTGTTWLKSLIFSIVNRSSKHRLTLEHPHELVPFLEVQVYSHSDEPPNMAPSDMNDSRRIFATHISYQLLKETLDSCDCRVVYVTRNPKDTLVSTWHFANKMHNMGKVEPWSLDVATDKFCRGVFPSGPYYEHVIGYKELSLKRPTNVLFLTYEEMINDPHWHVKKLGEFLGCPFDGEDEVQEIVRSCSIDVLKNHEVNKSEESPAWFPSPYNSFFRKGVVGDYRNYLSDEAIQRIDALTKQKFHPLAHCSPY